MRKYDLSAIMTKAWELFRKTAESFAECLHRAWLSAKAREINEKRIEAAKQAAGALQKKRQPGATGRKQAMKLFMVARHCLDVI